MAGLARPRADMWREAQAQSCPGACNLLRALPGQPTTSTGGAGLVAQACEELNSSWHKGRLGRAETWHCQGGHGFEAPAITAPWFAQKGLPAAAGWQRSRASTGQGHRKAAVVHSRPGVAQAGRPCTVTGSRRAPPSFGSRPGLCR